MGSAVVAQSSLVLSSVISGLESRWCSPTNRAVVGIQKVGSGCPRWFLSAGARQLHGLKILDKKWGNPWSPHFLEASVYAFSQVGGGKNCPLGSTWSMCLADGGSGDFLSPIHSPNKNRLCLDSPVFTTCTSFPRYERVDCSR